jgi:glycosyltransferase involved in cell wall biosynthesis
MKNNISTVIITKNCEGLIGNAIKSAKVVSNEIIIVDDYSIDKTAQIAKKLGAKVYFQAENNLGKRKNFAIGKAKNKWILSLDADEKISRPLAKEINFLFSKPIDVDAFQIPYQNHLFGKPINYGGENYSKIRIFKKDKAKISSFFVHEDTVIKSKKIGVLRNKIYHYSYRSVSQMFAKFTDYAIREAKQKARKHEKSSLKKIFLYPLHMFWARFFKDKGYRDGIRRVILDAGFAYMELLTYSALLLYNLMHK